MTRDSDATGIYYYTHWFNAGNTASCNYVFNGDHCYYLDSCSSGVTIRGGACINTHWGAKVNCGKWNTVRDLVFKDLESWPGVCTCLCATEVNCGLHYGRYWDAMRNRYYNSDAINTRWPWFPRVCMETSIRGHPCNVDEPGTYSANDTGNCSGLPTDNHLSLIITNRGFTETYFRACERIPTIGNFSTVEHVNVTDVQSALFLNYVENDLGVREGSSIYDKVPDFKSCPKADVGPQVVDGGESRNPSPYYTDFFGQPAPEGFALVVTMNTSHLMDWELIRNTSDGNSRFEWEWKIAPGMRGGGSYAFK
eukprot:TRINITY_DN25830_c0_g3_i1.p1 TRINITY_DN25830_c0_g3~~TRINITY_DN25830_c0_g3_i1.p1  ORF type:complete len:354 (+),score=-20.35 TRINITY_DN25830_c0_g3_i1:138-1064(+)